MVEVVQADRDAAALIAEECNPEFEFLPDMYRRGELDNSPLALAFAKHRLAHLPNTDLSEERAREVLAAVVADVASGKEADAEWRDWLLVKPHRLDSQSLNAKVALRAMQQYAAGLQGEVERLREALKPFSDALGDVATTDFERWSDTDTIEFDGFPEFITVGDLRRARAALGDAQR